MLTSRSSVDLFFIWYVIYLELIFVYGVSKMEARFIFP